MIEIDVDVDWDDGPQELFIQEFSGRVNKNIKKALEDIKTEWGYELLKEQQRLHNNTRRRNKSGLPVPNKRSWTPLTEKYAAEKAKAYSRRGKKKGDSGVRYNSILKRTGTLLRGYINEITIDTIGNRVILPYPLDVAVYARAHQLGSGFTKAAHGKLPARPFDTEILRRIADSIMEKALMQAVNNE